MTVEDQKIYDDIHYFLNNNGVGKGTNTTLSLCAWLIKEYASLQQKEYSKQPLYAFLYNPMIHESYYITVSIHRTMKGAEIALICHKNDIKKEWDNEDHAFAFDHFRDWKIEEIQILD